MKTTTLKTTLNILLVCALIISTVIITRNLIHNIKYLYGLESTGKGTVCFFDMIQ